MEQYRTLVPRFWALILDSVLLLPLSILDELLRGADFSPAAKWSLLLTVNLAGTIYFIAMHAVFGQTVGKMLMKIKVLDALSESPIKFRQALLRDLPQLLFVAGSFVFLNQLAPEAELNPAEYTKNPLVVLTMVYGLIDIFSVFTNEKRRALHDYIAGTVVVRTNV
jgi:uncharacterized RDD family membrane protein YckC